MFHSILQAIFLWMKKNKKTNKFNNPLYRIECNDREYENILPKIIYIVEGTPP